MTRLEDRVMTSKIRVPQRGQSGTSEIKGDFKIIGTLEKGDSMEVHASRGVSQDLEKMSVLRRKTRPRETSQARKPQDLESKRRGHIKKGI